MPLPVHVLLPGLPPRTHAAGDHPRPEDLARPARSGPRPLAALLVRGRATPGHGPAGGSAGTRPRPGAQIPAPPRPGPPDDERPPPRAGSLPPLAVAPRHGVPDHARRSGCRP